MSVRDHIKPGTGAEFTADRILELAGAELSQAVFRTANALLANPSDAEELTLDVLVKLHEQLEAQQVSDFAAWLEALPHWLDKATIAKAKTRTKKRKRHSGKLEELALMHEQIGEATDPESEALLTREVLAHLPSKHRFVLVLKWGLGHDVAQLAELLDSDVAGIQKAITGVEQALRGYANYDRVAKQLLDGLQGEAKPTPLDSYIQVFGRPDEATATRIKRRFDTYLREGAGDLELTGEYHPSSGSGFYDALELQAALPVPSALPAGEAQEIAVPITAPGSQSRAPWIVAGLAVIAVVILGAGQLRMSQELGAVVETLAQLDGDRSSAEASAGPEPIEPGSFVKLAHDSRAEASREGKVALVRNDAKGAEFELQDGWISLHVKRVEGVEWIVRDGAYAVASTGTRFRVSHSKDAMPEVDVFEGSVRVSGGELGVESIDVSSADRTLAAALAKRKAAPAPAAPSETNTASDEQGVDAIFARAMAVRADKETEATALLRAVVDRGDDGWTSERAFEELRTLVAPDEREALRAAYFERFPDGAFAEAFTAIECQSQTGEAADACWTSFAENHPDSLYGP